MQTRKVMIPLFVSLLVVACIPCAFAQLDNQTLTPHRTPGYYNSDTGAFEPLRPAVEDAIGFAVSPTTGTLVFNFTITVKSALPKNGVITCSTGGAVIETSYSADETGFGIAKLVSGSTYSCSVTMPYSWLLNTPTTDKIILSYKAQINAGLQVTAENGTAVTVISGTARLSSQTIASIKVPANGATTTQTVNITL